MSVAAQIANQAARPCIDAGDDELKAELDTLIRSAREVGPNHALRPQWLYWLGVSVIIYLRDYSEDTLRQVYSRFRWRVLASHGYLGDDAYDELVTGQGRGRVHCIECGCCDDAGCWDEAADDVCSWQRLDQATGLGVCSACPEAVARFDAGDREVRVPIELVS